MWVSAMTSGCYGVCISNTCRYCIWSMFPRARHLNLMDKIRSHVIQMNSNSWSLNSRVLDVGTLNSEASDSRVSDSSPSSQIQDLCLGSFCFGSEIWSRGSEPEIFLGFVLGWWTIGPDKGWSMTQQLPPNFLVWMTMEILVSLKSGSNFRGLP